LAARIIPIRVSSSTVPESSLKFLPKEDASNLVRQHFRALTGVRDFVILKILR
jgi:hypothetical protein